MQKKRLLVKNSSSKSSAKQSHAIRQRHTESKSSLGFLLAMAFALFIVVLVFSILASIYNHAGMQDERTSAQELCPSKECQGSVEIGENVYTCAYDEITSSCSVILEGEQRECDQGEVKDCSFQQGVCEGAQQSCGEDGKWLACDYGGNYEQNTEMTCDDGLDNDCDSYCDIVGASCAGGGNSPDSDCEEPSPLPPICDNGEQDTCPLDLGVCAGSFQTCTNNNWPGCDATNYGPLYEETETSCDGLDNDCDGETDEGKVCEGTKWNPGHYMLTFVNSPKSHFDKIFGEENFKGVQRRYFWRELEPAKGNYDFSKIEEDLAYLEQNGKHLVAQVTVKQFSSEPPVPDYILNEPEYEGGIEHFKQGQGSIARIWDPEVLKRLKALDAALGARFDQEPYFEAINTQETALSINRDTAVGYTNELYLDAIKQRITNLKQAFPHTNVIQYANHLWTPGGAPYFPEIADYVFSIGAGWGGPDVFPTGGNWPNPPLSYEYYPVFAGSVPLGTAVQAPELGGPAGTFTVEQLFNLGVDTLQLNYVFWLEAEDTQYSLSFTNDIVPYVNSQNGRINADCPAKAAPCVS